MMQEEKWLSPKEVAAILGVHLDTVYQLLMSGRLAGTKVGRLWRIEPEALRRIGETG